MKNSFKIIALCSIGLFLGHSVKAQDLMARQANMDKQLKAVDSISLQITYERELDQAISNIYPSWRHDCVDCYANDPKPAFHKIDLTGFTMPTTSRQITSNYGYRRRFRRNHYGLDVKIYTGDTIVAAFSGKVRIVSYNRGGYGYYVVIRHANGLETVYGHLSRQLVHEDQMVQSGQPIGLGGSTGRSTGPHLHFETRVLGDPIDPAFLFDFANQDVTGDSYMYYNRNYKAAITRLDDAAFEKNDQANSMLAAVAEQAVVEKNEAPRYHKVKKGDNLYTLARSNNLTVEQLCRINGLKKSAKLRVGQILKTKN